MLRTVIPFRGYVVFAHDIIMAGASFAIALYLRLGFDDPIFMPVLMQGTPVFMAVAALVFWFSGLYRGIWRYASMNDLIAVCRATFLVLLVFLFVMFLWTRLDLMPRSTLIINWFVLTALVGGPRFLYRVYKDRRVHLAIEKSPGRRIPVLLIGAGDGAELFIRSLKRNPDSLYRVVGILSEKSARVGRHILGVEVLGTVPEFEEVLSFLKTKGIAPERVVLTKEKMEGSDVRRLLDSASAKGITLARLPRLTDFKSGLEDRIEVKPVAIEDLLGRAQATLDRDGMAQMIAGRRVLITGAGGSIGSELVRQVASFAPAALGLLENSEFSLYRIDMEIRGSFNDIPVRPILCDVRDRDRLNRVFDTYKPELVFHAAALKHVPMVEENPLEGIMTNVIGTRNVVDACLVHDVHTMVQISTDKAVNPTNVMGATKRVAEQYCQAIDLAHEQKGDFRIIAVRFGNVLGSTGSVVPLFQKQLEKGGPITVTHPDMVRYFMTIHEAVELVLQASSLGEKGEQNGGKIFVLEMGEPVRIVNLAKQMIRLAGLEPDRDIEIQFSGIRPGEKLFEEMFHASEEFVPTSADGILLAAPRFADIDAIKQELLALESICRAGDEAGAKQVLHRLVPEFVSGPQVKEAKDSSKSA